ncbi:MAG: hypothetical protein JWL62_3763, partial [Hyphomicrobiales bacterium]|nr:hypothetical protein [Hyphomicrobiales bacterium]
MSRRAIIGSSRLESQHVRFGSRDEESGYRLAELQAIRRSVQKRRQLCYESGRIVDGKGMTKAFIVQVTTEIGSSGGRAFTVWVAGAASAH